MKHIHGLFLLILLSACATPPLPPVDSPEHTWRVRQDKLLKIQNWQLSGRVAVTTEIEAWHLDIAWQQQADQYQIQLSGPFGSGRVRLTGSDAGVYLYNDGEVYFATEPDALLREHTGVAMPLASLHYWIRGLPNPRLESRAPRLDRQGRLASLQENGWDVELKRYVQVDSLQLPNKLFIRGKPDIEVRMIVDEWQLPRIHE